MTATLSPLQKAFFALQDAEARITALEMARTAPVAVVGLACRAAGGVVDAETLWQLLSEGRDAIGPVPKDRWDHDALYDPDPNATGKIVTRSGGFVEGIDQFDPDFFGISPREADGMDPQQRMLLEVCWEALENAGQAPDRLQRSLTGVYIGAAGSDYAYLQLRSGAPQGVDPHFASGIAHSVLSGRVSYLLGLQGPSITIDTACSSSLVAVHLACQALRSGECRFALAGGVNLILSPDIFVALSQAHMLAPDGRCKAFGAAADGFGRGEGCAIVALKLLSEAVSDGDRVLAVIRGSAVNQDGPSSGLTAPNGPAQEAVIRAALAQAQVEPHEVSYVEAHGTGTELGDPLEARALSAVFCGQRNEPLLVGSVKTNVGHLEGAAGVLGLVKLVLSLQRGVIPQSLHCGTPSPHIAWNDLALRVVADAATPWPSGDGRRIGGVSSFGFSGTNAHVIVEGIEAQTVGVSRSRPELLPVSAHTEDALAALARALGDATAPDMQLADIARTLGVGRAHRVHRAVIEASSIEEFRQGLDALANGRDCSQVRRARVPHGDPPRVAFLFTGQGVQYPGMAAKLYETAPSFREAFDRCDAVLLPLLGASLRKTVLASTEAAALEQTGLAQPALFTLEYALAEMFGSLGVAPVAVMGHSVGELVAACVSGAIELTDALRLVTARGAMMQSLPPGGAMAAVFAPEQRVAEAVAPFAASVSIAAVNGPMQTVISGAAEAVRRVCADLALGGVKTHPLAVSHAFHSPQVEPVMAAFERKAAEVAFSTPRMHLISNVTGQRIKAGELASAQYWSRHLREPVRFADGLSSLAALKVDICLELGPHPVLTTFADSVFADAGPRAVATLRRQTDDWRAVLSAVGELYLAGVEINWCGLDPGRVGRPISLPNSPFVRRRHWFKRKTLRPAARYEHPLLGQRLRSALGDVVQFESEIDAEGADFISDHVVQGRTIMPAAGMIEMALSAGRRAAGDFAAIQSLLIAAPLVLDHGPRVLQTLVRMHDTRPATFEILSSPVEADKVSWTLHAQGEYAAGETTIETPALAPNVREISAEAHYEGLASRGLTFGKSLQLVRGVRTAEGVAIGSIAGVPGDSYVIQPAMLDACVQVIAAAMPDRANQTFLPVSIDRIAFVRTPVGPVESCVVIQEAKPSLLRANILVRDRIGDVMRIKGIALRPARGESASDLYRVEWRQVPGEANDAVWAPGPTALNVALAPRLHELAQEQQDLEVYHASFLALERLSVQWIIRMLTGLGWHPREGERATTEDLAKALGVAERHGRLLRRFLDILVEDGVLRREEEAYRVVAWPAAIEEISPSDPHEPRTMITTACGDRLADILTEREDPLQRLFPNGSSAIAERLYRDSPEAKVFNTLLGEAVSRVVAQAPAGRKVRILEVGAGTGGSTAKIAPLLRDANVSYCFTDLGATFVAEARVKFAAYPFMSFQRFDLEANAQAQGLALESFDVIIGANCVHATANLKQTLGRLRDLLAPGGLLFLLEVTAFERWIDLTFALTEGWWRFNDFDLRASYPLLDTSRWTKLLEGLGFAASQIGEPLPTSRESLIAAQKPAHARSHKIALVGGPETVQRELASALARRGQVVSTATAESVESSFDIVAYLGFLSADGDAPLDTAREALTPLIDSIKRLGTQAACDVRLTVATRGAASIPDVAPAQAAALGFLRTAALELGELRPALIDLDPGVSVEAQVGALADALIARSKEPERALRGNAVFGSRLTQLNGEDTPPVRLESGASGVLEDLVLTPAQRPAPTPNQVEIRVTASGLNFRDLMNALAMRNDAEPLGGECAGIVSAVGSSVEEFAVGDAVVTATSGAFATYVLSDARAVAKRPRGWSDSQAASLPLAAMTAHHALIDVAQVKPRQLVLIHAGAGGVGMAAMQIAKRCGARIFATAGSEQKRSLLRMLGAERTFSSRRLEFAHEIVKATDGRGVDVVLNSLAGPFIEASVRCLASDGVFIEIGKNDIWSNARFLGFRPSARYVVLDLATSLVRDRPAWNRLFRRVIADAESGALAPPPVRAFPLGRAKDAFSFMAQARHVGKIVLTQEPGARAKLELDPDGLYFVTGGYGGIGLATAERLFERGARGFALVGRTSPSAGLGAKLNDWRKAGAEILEMSGDIASSSAVEDMFARIDATGRPLRGVIHSAGVLSDSALLKQDWAQFEPPLLAKIRGAWLLHKHTLDRRLDFFALYSSIAGTFGAPGQANHAAANSFMDALAYYRRERGLPGISIAWGMWSELGAAAARSIGSRAVASGVGAISPSRGLDTLETLLADAPPHVVVTPMDWSAYFSRWMGNPPPFFADVARLALPQDRTPRAAPKSKVDRDLLKRLEDAVPSGRHEILATFVAATVQRVLESEREIDRRRPLNEMGMDSLLAVQLRNRLGTSLGLSPGLPATLVFDCPTVELLAEHLNGRLLPASNRSERIDTTATDAVQSIDDMPDAEIDAMFDRMARA